MEEFEILIANKSVNTPTTAQSLMKSSVQKKSVEPGVVSVRLKIVALAASIARLNIVNVPASPPVNRSPVVEDVRRDAPDAPLSDVFDPITNLSVLTSTVFVPI